jgi:hypothetical protein
MFRLANARQRLNPLERIDAAGLMNPRAHSRIDCARSGR